VTIGNDSDLGAIAERLRGSARGAANVIYLSGQIGVGAGIVIDGSLLMGAQGYGGEVGHMRINPKGRECRCGSHGCWETEIGEPALRLAAHASDRETVQDIVARAAAGDKVAQKGLKRVGEWLGIGVGNLVNIFNPDVVVFGGTLREVLPATRDQVELMVAESLPAPREHVQLSLPALGGDSTLVGAAEAAFEPLLHDPLAVVGSVQRRVARALAASPA